MIFFNSSMPRAGSELMQQLLHQNPAIYGSRTDGVLELLYSARQNFSSLPEFSSQNPQLMNTAFKAFCKGGLVGWANTLKGERAHICIKSRGITNWLEWFDQILGEPARVIVMVRDLRCIVASMEKAYRINKMRHPEVDRPMENLGATVAERVEQYMTSPPITIALKRLFGLFERGLKSRVHIVKYEDLVTSPQKVMDEVYEYLDIYGQKQYTVEVEELPELDYEHPGAYGFFGDHSTYKRLTPSTTNPREMLGRPICDQILANNRWYFEELNY